jgi:preprotein translocase SecE subunit
MSWTIYKKGQGTAARGLTAAVAILVGGWAGHSMYVHGATGTLGLVFTALVAFLFGVLPLGLILFHRRTVDVLIETQQEMKKVSWSTRREVVGATVVVVAVVALLSMFILVTDFVILNFLFGTLTGLY